MDERARAEDWINVRLSQAREAFRQQPPGPHDLSLEQYEQQLRRQADGILRPTAQYVGLELEAAQAAAVSAGDHLCVHRGAQGHRANWRSDRVHVEVGPQGRVHAARRDRAPWDDAP